MSPKAIRVWSLIHKWTSIVCTAFLLMLCITGLPLIFHDEIDDALNPDSWSPANPDGPLLDLDQVLAVAMADRPPGHVPIFMSFDEDRPVVNVTTGPTPDAPGHEMHFASFDQTSGNLVPPATGGEFMEVILQIHTDMYLGLGGMLFLGLMGLLFIASVVSGVVLYAPFMRKLPFGTVRVKRSSRLKWLDYHNLLGIVTVAWVSVVGVTGVINTLAVPIVDAWRETSLADLTAEHRGKPRPAVLSSLHDAVEQTKQAAPGSWVQFVAFPGGSYSTDHHYAVFLQGDTPLTKHIIRPALIDAETGKFAAIREMPWYNQMLSLSQPLHFGDYGGLPLKILWAILDIITIIILASGIYLWVTRRKPVLAELAEVSAIPAPAE